MCALFLDEETLSLPYRIESHFLFHGTVIVLFDPWRGPEYRSQWYDNLRCYLLDGSLHPKELWKAELPEYIPIGMYCEMAEGDPFTASSLAYNCKIDPRTGKILEKTFFK